MDTRDVSTIQNSMASLISTATPDIIYGNHNSTISINGTLPEPVFTKNTIWWMNVIVR